MLSSHSTDRTESYATENIKTKSNYYYINIPKITFNLGTGSGRKTKPLIFLFFVIFTLFFGFASWPSGNLISNFCAIIDDDLRWRIVIDLEKRKKLQAGDVTQVNSALS